MISNEYRAVFNYPNDYEDYGPWQSTLEETRNDHPWRSEESHGYRVGTQQRSVTDPKPIEWEWERPLKPEKKPVNPCELCRNAPFTYMGPHGPVQLPCPLCGHTWPEK